MVNPSLTNRHLHGADFHVDEQGILQEGSGTIWLSKPTRPLQGWDELEPWLADRRVISIHGVYWWATPIAWETRKLIINKRVLEEFLIPKLYTPTTPLTPEEQEILLSLGSGFKHARLSSKKMIMFQDMI